MLKLKLYYSTLGILLFSCFVTVVFATETDVTEGSELYHDYCSVCHGDKGDGNSRAKGGLSTDPRDFTMPGLAKVLTREQMVDMVLSGKPGTAMAGWSTRLSREQAENIVDYVRNTFMSEDGETRQAQSNENKTQQELDHHLDYIEQPFSDGLMGNYERGKLFYHANCVTCHGANGDGNGPRAYFIFPKPRNFLSQSSRARLNRTVLFNAIKYGVRGKEMPAWGKVINDQDIADIAEYVFKAMIQSDNVVQSESTQTVN